MIKMTTKKASLKPKRCLECNRRTIRKMYKGKMVDWCEDHGDVTGFTGRN